MGFRVSRHGSNPGLPFSSWVTFGVLFNFSEGQFPPLEHGSHDLYLSGLGDACVEAPSIAPDPYCVLNLAQWFWKPRKPCLGLICSEFLGLGPGNLFLKKKAPQFLVCCKGWDSLMEKYWTGILKLHLSSLPCCKPALPCCPWAFHSISAKQGRQTSLKSNLKKSVRRCGGLHLSDGTAVHHTRPLQSFKKLHLYRVLVSLAVLL